MPKPLIIGDATWDEDRIESFRETQQRWDNSYVPGYSEARRENEIRVSKGLDPIPIPRLQWVRANNVAGENVPPDEMINWHMLGFAACTQEDLKNHGWSMGPQCFEHADGTIRRGDLMLTIVPHQVNEKNVQTHREFTAEFEGRPAHVEDVGSKRLRGSLDQLVEYAEKQGD